MYLKPEKGRFEIICDVCKKHLDDVVNEYIIVYRLEHYCPACFTKKIDKERKEYYKQRLIRLKEKKHGKTSL
jgi:uncharacterized CHY-type Zn-finger protein